MAVGVALGDFTAMTLSMLGLGALLAASATLFTILKWVGAAYLVWLGIKLWRAGGALEANAAHRRGLRRQDAGPCLAGDGAQPQEHHLLRGLPARLPRPACRLPDARCWCSRRPSWCWPFANAFGYALVASRARGFVSNPRAIRIINKVGGGLLIGAGRRDRDARGLAELNGDGARRLQDAGCRTAGRGRPRI